VKFVTGSRSGRALRIGIVISRFNQEVTDRLLDGALDALEEAKVPRRRTVLVGVPGALELPGAASKLAATGKVDAVVCLGAVIRGETPHFEYVSAGAQQGILQVGLSSGIPVTFGVLTCDTVEQAIQRSGGRWGNKGSEAALDAVEMANLYREIS
jgi:6,7-dimethyl-8-ribityllumazine synthase